jgi:hypothetical protein
MKPQPRINDNANLLDARTTPVSPSSPKPMVPADADIDTGTSMGRANLHEPTDNIPPRVPGLSLPEPTQVTGSNLPGSTIKQFPPAIFQEPGLQLRVEDAISDADIGPATSGLGVTSGTLVLRDQNDDKGQHGAGVNQKPLTTASQTSDQARDNPDAARLQSITPPTELGDFVGQVTVKGLEDYPAIALPNPHKPTGRIFARTPGGNDALPGVDDDALANALKAQLKHPIGDDGVISREQGMDEHKPSAFESPQVQPMTEKFLNAGLPPRKRTATSAVDIGASGNKEGA